MEVVFNQVHTDIPDEAQMVFFPKVGFVRLLDTLDSGIHRICKACDYVDRQGRAYVVKEAHNFSLKARAINLTEYTIYQNASPEAKNELPIFLDATEDGCYVLVERCTTASDYHSALTCDDIEDLVYGTIQYIPLYDMHDTNWGYTLYDQRPVVLDIACDLDDSRSVAEITGCDMNEFDDATFELIKEARG